MFYIAILASVVKLQFFEKEMWAKVVKKAVLREKPMRPERGDIYDVNGKLLATTVSRYDIRIDCAAQCLDVKSCGHGKAQCDCKVAFNKQLDDFCSDFVRIFPNVKKDALKRKLEDGRKRKKRALLLKSQVTVFELDSIKSIRKRGANLPSAFVAALSVEEIKKREYVYGILGKRTIGKSSGKVGIESGYDSILSGKEEMRIFQMLRDQNLIPADGSVNKDGFDLVTTIDIELQDIVTSALQRGLMKCEGEFGAAVLMDVKTGQIRACANLNRGNDGKYWESLNNVVGYSYQPGSTFKTISMLLTLNDFEMNLSDSVRILGGDPWTLFGKPISDVSKPKKSHYTMFDIMDNSSNIGISKVVYGHYKDDPQKFLSGLRRMGIFDSITVDIPGSGIPIITLEKGKKEQKEAIKAYSFGYQIMVTPLHLATFYNAIANDGRMVRPRFVSKIKYKGSTVKEMKTEVVVKSIANSRSLNQIRELLFHVANSKKDNVNNLAYKTGTARLIDRTGMVVGYDASVAGYFPADKPRYTLVVLIHKPKVGGYYGGAVAAPILKEVSDILSLMERSGKEVVYDEAYSHVPMIAAGFREDIEIIYDRLGLNVSGDLDSRFISVARGADNSVVFKRYDTNSNIVPNVIGMGVKDAVYVLESRGLIVKVEGAGGVVGQSLPAGYRFKKGDEIGLSLNYMGFKKKTPEPEKEIEELAI